MTEFKQNGSNFSAVSYILFAMALIALPILF